MTELAAWYQRKIGTYDKQEWETTIEQRLNDMAQIPLKSARLRPELIDVDLVRGSSFPKAKPIQGLATVVRLALCRVLLLPLWMRWWSLHTSRPAASFLLGLWLLQLLNTALYIMAPPSTHLDASCVLVPLSLMAGLGVVHALIVSTGPPLSSSYRFRSLNIEERRNRRRLSAQPEGILRQESSFSSDIINSSSDITQLNIKQTKCLNRGRKTTSPVKENIPINTDNKKDEWVNGFRIPTVRLSPPLGQSVSFDLREKEWEGSDESSKEDDAAESPVHLRRRNQQNVPEEPVVHEGDDGFESLNGNNSNGSENGEDSKVDKILFENKLKKRNVMKLENDCDENVKDICDTKHVEDASVASGSTEMFGDCLSQDGGRVLSDDGGSSTNLSVEHGRKRDRKNKGGAKFRNSWVQELLEQRPPLSEGKTRKPRKEWKSPPSSSSGEECDTASASIRAPSQQTDWVGQTTNSEECSYSSEHEESEWEGYTGDPAWEPCAILSPASDRVSCTFWENGRALKAHMSAVDISRAIVGRAERHLDRAGSGLWPGTLLAALLAALPPAARLLQVMVESEAAGSEQVTLWDLPGFFFMNSPLHLLCSAFGDTSWERTISLISVILRLGLGALVFFLLAVAERAFRQRFLYAKLFSHLTSARRARQSALPHFRLNRVRNIKTWLSVRSYLKRRGPQRSVDVIVSAAFFMMVLLISFLVIELLKDPGQVEGHRAAEALGWVLALGAVLIQLAALGTRAARKHRCLPVLLTEQINLHLAMERRPASKDRLAVANNVLKLAADLLKELESPFKISGLSANPYLYTITKVVVLSALSGVLSEILGFKLKLHKIKIK